MSPQEMIKITLIDVLEWIRTGLVSDIHYDETLMLDYVEESLVLFEHETRPRPESPPELHPGQTVYWADTSGRSLSGLYRIRDILNGAIAQDTDLVLLERADGTEMRAQACDLIPVHLNDGES